MNFNHQKLPIGRLLQKLGLVSEKQLQTALETQSKYSKLRIGEILTLQKVVSKKTVDFFVEQWQDVQAKGKQFPLGYYLKKAGLLKEEQIKIILTEQKQTKLKFGSIAIQKGWLNQNTIDFFLQNLKPQPPQLISLAALEKYSQKNLHLELKVSNSQKVLQEILFWTGGHPVLTKILCQILVNSDLAIPNGIESTAIKNLVKNNFFDNWKTQNTAEYLRTVAKALLNNQQCQPELLLTTYRKILLRGKISSNSSLEQQELLNLGLAIADHNCLKVANPIFQCVFNLNWTEEQLLKIRQSAIQAKTNNNSFNTPQPVTKLGSVITLLGILLLTPLVIVLNNYYFKSKLKLDLFNSETSNSDVMLQLCQNQISPEAQSQADLIVQLEQGKQNLAGNFPDECETMLHKLWVLAAPQLGKENRVIDAVGYLCQIPSDSDNFSQAKIWIDRWYNSPIWGQPTQAYLNLVSECPAAEDRIMKTQS